MEAPEVNELATLRQTVAELTAKNTARKARIQALEASVRTLQTNLASTQTALYAVEVGEPSQTLANAISHVPELWLAEFSRLGFKIEKKDGKLMIMRDGKPVEDAEFTVAGMTKLLTKSDDPTLKNFAHLIVVSRASGGGAIGSSQMAQQHEHAQPTQAPVAKPQFGLR